MAVNIACSSQTPACLSQTQQKLVNFIENGESIAPDLIPSVFCHGIKSSNSEVFLKLLNIFETSSKSTMRNIILTSLGCTQNSELLLNYLKYAVNPENSLTNDERLKILTSPMNQAGNSLRVVINFVTENFNEITRYKLLQTICNSVASRIYSQNLFDNFSVLLELLRSNDGISETDADKFRKTANFILDWQKKNTIYIQNFLENQEETTKFITGKTTEIIATTTTTLRAGSIFVSTILMTFTFLIKILF